MVMDTPIVVKLMLLAFALSHASSAAALDFTIVRPSYRASIDPVRSALRTPSLLHGTCQKLHCRQTCAGQNTGCRLASCSWLTASSSVYRRQQALCAWTQHPPCMVSDRPIRPCSTVLWCCVLLPDDSVTCCALPHDLQTSQWCQVQQQQPASWYLIICRHVTGTIVAREAEDMCDFLNDGGRATDAYVDYGTKTKPPYHMRVTLIDCFALDADLLLIFAISRQGFTC